MNGENKTLVVLGFFAAAVVISFIGAMFEYHREALLHQPHGVSVECLQRCIQEAAP